MTRVVAAWLEQVVEIPSRTISGHDSARRRQRRTAVAVTLQDKLAKLTPERLAKVERRAAELYEEMTLRELRRAHELTQTAVAERLRIKQASVARIEQRSDLLLSTLRSYVQAMGGELDIVVRLPNRRPIRLRELADLGSSRLDSKGCPADAASPAIG